jgi:hypothetical protein
MNPLNYQLTFPTGRRYYSEKPQSLTLAKFPNKRHQQLTFFPSQTIEVSD